MTSRSPWPIVNAVELPPPRGRSASRRGSPKDTIATIVSSARPRPMRVAVPGDRVAAVSVVAAARGHERLAELGQVVGRQGLAGRREQRMGEGLARAVGRHQAGDVDHAVVHRPLLGPPRDPSAQGGEHVVGGARPSWGGCRPTRPASAAYGPRPGQLRSPVSPARSVCPTASSNRVAWNPSPQATIGSNRCSTIDGVVERDSGSGTPLRGGSGTTSG